MPWQRSRYPANWGEISQAIRLGRAAGVCEWCGRRNGDAIPGRKGRVVLTVAHLGVPFPDGRPGDKHNKADCRPENLVALCQKCHLNFDLRDHIEASARTRARKRAERWAARGYHQVEMRFV